MLLTLTHVTRTCCTTINPANLLPTADEGDSHDCCEVVSLCTKPRHDISETPLSNPDLILFINGSSMRLESGGVGTGCSVVDHFEVVESHSLPGTFSAQAAELVAYIEHVHWQKG